MTDPLRDVLAAALHGIHVPGWYNGHRSDDVAVAAAIIAALAQQGVTLTREPGLDVDRLMEAMDEAFELDDVFVDDVAAWWRPFAAKVAHEYAALASEDRP